MSGFTPARQLILDALREDEALPRAAMGEQDWMEFTELARMHRLGPMLHHRLAGSSLTIPQQVREQLQESHRRHAMRNLRLYRELVTAARLLDDEGISFIALKGAYLAHFAYPEPGLRPMRDLDLLLEPEDAVQAFNVLRAHGYQSIFGGEPEAYFSDRIHLPPLSRPGGISIELHHRLTPPGKGRGFEQSMRDRSIVEPVGGIGIAFPCAEDMLLHLCVHATLDHRLDLGPLALADVAMLVGARQIDWQDFLQRVHEGNWQRHVLPMLFLAQRHLGARVPEELVAALAEGGNDAAWRDSAEYLLFSDPEDHKLLDYDVQEILYAASFLDRASGLAGAIFPPRTVIARHFPVDAASSKAFLYYPHRWYRMVRGKLPALLKAYIGRKQSLRRLASYRSAFDIWLRGSAD